MYTDIIFATCQLEISGITAELGASGLHFVGFVYSMVCFARPLLDQFQFFLQSFMHSETSGKTDADPLGNGDRGAVESSWAAQRKPLRPVLCWVITTAVCNGMYCTTVHESAARISTSLLDNKFKITDSVPA